MSRQVVLDTETTGLDPERGHRVIEIGAVEIASRQSSGRVFHVYLNPDREIDAGAMEVHGITKEFLAGKPRFADVVDDFLDFIADAELIIHNAPFDVGFLDAELARLDRGALASHCNGVLDTLRLAKDLHPGQKNNLDALCRRYEVDNSGRSYHGALLDAQLLAEVYLMMTRGQDSLAIEVRAPSSESGVELARPKQLRVIAPDAAELAAHAEYLRVLGKEAGREITPW